MIEEMKEWKWSCELEKGSEGIKTTGSLLRLLTSNEELFYLMKSLKISKN